jgi:hypothetical protein
MKEEENDVTYLNQRHEPNSLRPIAPINDINFELGPVNVNEGELNKYLQRLSNPFIITGC